MREGGLEPPRLAAPDPKFSNQPDTARHLKPKRARIKTFISASARSGCRCFPFAPSSSATVQPQREASARSVEHAIASIRRLAAESQDERRPASSLVEKALLHFRQWLAGDSTENTAAQGLAALAAAFEQCAAADNFDLGLSPGAAEQVELLAERLEALGWRRGQLPTLAATLKPGERIKFLSFGAVQVARPDGRVRLIYSNEVLG